MAQQLSAVERTCRITAGFRAVEQQYHGSNAIIHDPLAGYLAGQDALQLAEREWAALTASQGPGKHLRVPARNRILDDEVLAAIQRLGRGIPAQVVNIGCGMDTRPWRLPFPAAVAYFEVDQPSVMQLKQQLLSQAGAQVPHHTPQGPAPQLDPTTTQPPSLHHLPQQQPQASAAHSGSSHPLTCSSYAALAADLSQQALGEALVTAGFQQQVPTIWVAEALLYYLPLPKAVELLKGMARLSAPGSCLLATVVDQELYEADQRLQEGHYFAKMWHFSVDDLVTPPVQRLTADALHVAVEHAGGWVDSGVTQEGQQGQRTVATGATNWLQRSGWELAAQPRTTADLAQAQYGMGTYVADYGGAECYFWARLESLRQGG